MDIKVSLDNVYVPSEDVVAREIQGNFIIVPITSGIGDLEDEIFTLSETGKAIWDRLDRKRTLKDIVKDLTLDFGGSPQEIEKDVVGFTEELLKRKMLVEVKGV